MVEVAAAFAAGTVVGSLLSLRRGASAPPTILEAPAPPPLPQAKSHPHKGKILLKMRTTIQINELCGPDGEEKRERGSSDTAVTTSPKKRFDRQDILSVSSKLKRAPPLLSVDEKKTMFFHESPVLKELLVKTQKL